MILGGGTPPPHLSSGKTNLIFFVQRSRPDLSGIRITARVTSRQRMETAPTPKVHTSQIFPSSLPVLDLNGTSYKRTEIFNSLSFSERISLVVSNAAIDLLGLILNFVVLLAVRNLTKYRARRTAYGRDVPVSHSRSQIITYYFIKQLVYSDLVTCLVGIPVQMADISLQIHRTRAMCASLKFFRVFIASTSFYLLAVINFERWWAISFPFRAFSLRRVRWLARAAWIFAFLLSVPILFLATSKEMKLNDSQYVFLCSGDHSLYRINICMIFFFPLLTTVVFAVLTVFRLRASKTTGLVTKAAHAAARFAINISMSSFLSCCPIILYIAVNHTHGMPSTIRFFALPVCGSVLNMNAVVNPLLTVYTFEQIRGKVKQYLRMSTRGHFSPARAKYKTEKGNSTVELVTIVRKSSRHKRSGLI